MDLQCSFPRMSAFFSSWVIVDRTLGIYLPNCIDSCFLKNELKKSVQTALTSDIIQIGPNHEDDVVHVSTVVFR